MVNPGERLQPPLFPNKPKMLNGLSQKAMWWAQGLQDTLSWTANTTGG
jgi:hypothetical protein